MNTRPLALFLVAAFTAVTTAYADSPVILRTQRGEVSPNARSVQVENHFGSVTLVAAAGNFGWEWNLRKTGDLTARAEAEAEEWRVEAREEQGTFRLIVFRRDRPED